MHEALFQALATAPPEAQSWTARPQAWGFFPSAYVNAPEARSRSIRDVCRPNKRSLLLGQPEARSVSYGTSLQWVRGGKHADEVRVIGGIVWLTGLSGSGKTTLASAVAARLSPQRAVEILDGDDIRRFLSAGLGYSRTDRDTNVHRIGYVARLLAKHGILVLVAAIAPYAETRAELRALSEAAGHPFIEVFVHASLETVIARDVKGLYQKARASEISYFTGISDPYEPPVAPDVEVRTDRADCVACVSDILSALVARGLLRQVDWR